MESTRYRCLEKCRNETVLTIIVLKHNFLELGHSNETWILSGMNYFNFPLLVL